MGHGQFLGGGAGKGASDQIQALPLAGHVTWGQPHPIGPGFPTSAMKWLSGRRKKKRKRAEVAKIENLVLGSQVSATSKHFIILKTEIE